MAINNIYHKQDKQCKHKRNIVARSRKHCYHGKCINITFSECVSVAVVIQHAKRMRQNCIVICCLFDCTILYTLSRKRHNFRENVAGYKMCLLIFSIILSETILIPRRIQRNIVINVHRSSCKVRVIIIIFQRHLNLVDRI